MPHSSPSTLLLLLSFVLLVSCFPTPTTASTPAPPPGAINPTLFDFTHNNPVNEARYAYKVVNASVSSPGVHSVQLELVSGAWLTSSQVDRPRWTHLLTINFPVDLDSRGQDNVFMMVTGGVNTKPYSAYPPDSTLVAMAKAVNAITAELRMVPNQPLKMCGDDVPRVEDAILAYGWHRYMAFSTNETLKTEWLPRLPMVNAVVRAMDAVQEVAERKFGTAPSRFTIGGASKRGWTTWLLPSADTRVVAIVPMVADVLSLQNQLRHHYRAYGTWTYAFKDYVEQDTTQYLNTDQFELMTRVIDPIHFAPHYNLPIYIIAAGGDEFFLPDSARFYLNSFVNSSIAPLYRSVPNVGHNMKGQPDIATSIGVFYYSVVHQVTVASAKFSYGPTSEQSLSSFKWVHTEVNVPTSTIVTARLWEAVNPDARDWRKASTGIVWTVTAETQLTNLSNNNTVTFSLSEPEIGFKASVMELTYKLAGIPVPLIETSEVIVLPDILPYAPCGEDCASGKLGAAAGLPVCAPSV